jgi:uncharacterized phage-associated protein
MNSIDEITDYLIHFHSEEDEPLSNLKLQKLLYYSQAWHLALKDKPLFDEGFEAWVHGPANMTIYQRFKDTKFMFSSITTNDIKNDSYKHLDPEVKKHIDEVLEVYSRFSGVELEEMTHNEYPWRKARKNFAKSERCSVIIDDDDMKMYYRKRLEE